MSVSVSVRVTRLSVTPVKGTRLRCVEQVALGPAGAAGDRRFYLVDERNRMVNGKVHPRLQEVVADWDSGRLTLTFPDGSSVDGLLSAGGPEMATRFFSRQAAGRLVPGPFSKALSAHLGAAVRLAELVSDEYRGSGVDRGYAGAATLISSGSLRRLAGEAEVDSVDARRFRMLIEVDGLGPHEEDAWVGRSVRVGEAVVCFEGHVGRCLVTGLDPDTGVPTLDALEVLGWYRRELDTTEPLPFGVYGRVLQPGPVRVGDTVAPVDL